MAFVIADRVRETTTTTGTGTITLAGAATGYQSFAAIGNGNSTYYAISGQTTSEWEVGIGTYTASGTTLSRTTVLASSNAGSKVVFSTGTKDVFVTQPAERAAIALSSTTILGINANQYNTNGSACVAIGDSAMAGTSSFSSIDNTAIGSQALLQDAGTYGNTMVGTQAGQAVTTGNNNVCAGWTTGYNLTTGSLNTFLGTGSGYWVTTGSNNTILGNYDGKSGGLDIRTLSGYIVLSDGNGIIRFVSDNNGNLYGGTSGATGMTNGFFFIPAAAGAPSGTPTTISGRVPMYYDSTNNNFYVYNGAWKKVSLT